MPDQDYRPKADGSTDSEDELDRVLNTALAKYAAIEPREGLEQRVLVSLRSQDSSSRSRWWTWTLAAAAFAVLIVAVAWHFSGHSRPSIANHFVIPQTTVVRMVPQSAAIRTVQRPTEVRRYVAKKAAPSNPNPKLDQFPSPQPMSEQEKILAMYINQDPEHAALIAEARMETLRQDEEEKMRAVSPK